MEASRQQGSADMSCRRINRWVLRNGTEGIPSEWRDHIDSCPKCRTLVTQIHSLDGALGQTAFPDPGEAYWAAFAPQVARRLEAATASRPIQVPVGRPIWARLWAPAIVVAALTFFIGRDLYLRRQTPSFLEKDVPVATMGTQQSAEPAQKTPSVVIGQKSDSPKLQPAPPTTPGESPRSNGSGATPSTRERPEVRAAAGKASGSVPTSANELANGNAPSGSQASATFTQPSDLAARPPSAADTKVFPERRVTIMGEIAADTEKKTREDERGLPGQGPHGLSERGFVDGAPSAETVRTLHSPERLEGPQLRAAAGASDSQSLAEAMRRLDQLAELRPQIAAIQAIDPSLRTPEQNRELCALWYRVGILATDRPLIDSALQQLSTCLKAADQTESAEWKTS
jgi:hypothetical protein